MNSFWQDQAFVYNESTDLYEGVCHKCKGVLIGHELGFTCKNCDLSGDLYTWLNGVKGIPSDKAEKTIKFYNETKKADEINPNQIATRILLTNKFIYLNNSFYKYQDGVFTRVNDIHIDKIIKSMLNLKFKTHVSNEIRNCLAIETLVNPDDVNKNRNMINFKNGMFDLKNLQLEPHDTKFLSTIQLNLDYDPDIQCELWTKTLNEIFQNDEEKISILQQFLGYCLVPDNSFQMSLLNIGEGANGKSLIMKTFQNIIGRQNYSTIQSADFNNKHYIACMAGKLVNISIESDNKMPIDDATFKAITSGDEFQVEEKFIAPYSVRLFCKLIFTMNDLPRVDDKSNAYFRRLKILRYNKEFKPGEQDRELEHKLVPEYPGIMNWMIYGMKNLYKNNGFLTNAEVDSEVVEYRKENNNVYMFSEDCLVIDPTFNCSKKDVYLKYCKYCGENGYKPFAIRKLGINLKKIYPMITEYMHPTGSMRMWRGLGILTD